MFPRFFRSLGWLRGLNVLGAGLSLSSLAAIVIGNLLAQGEGFDRTALAVIVGTLPFAVGWVWLLRWPRLMAWPTLLVVVSVVLAILADATAGMLRRAIWFGTELGGVRAQIVFAARHDLVVWAPFLLCSWQFLGGTLSKAREMAEKGLAGEEKGELLVGQTVLAFSASALFLWAILPCKPQSASQPLFGPVAPGLAPCLALAALLLGALATGLAWRREQRRHAFVRSVLRNEVPGYRVDETPTGKVLVRVANGQDGYRGADSDEEFCALDWEGQAVGVRRTSRR